MHFQIDINKNSDINSSNTGHARYFHYCSRLKKVWGVKIPGILWQSWIYYFEVLISSQNQMRSENSQDFIKKTLFCVCFSKFFNFNWILALETVKFMFNMKFLISRHTTQPWVWNSSSGLDSFWVIPITVLGSWSFHTMVLQCSGQLCMFQSRTR